MSKASETDTCPTTSVFRTVNRRTGPPSAFSFLIVSTTLARVAWSAGTNPNSTPATTEARMVNASTRQSSETSSVIGSGTGRSARSTARSATPDTRRRRRRRPRTAARLDEELSHEHAALRSDRQSNGDFLAAVARLREQKAGEIRARDEQHESDDDHQRRGGRNHHRIEHRIHGDVDHWLDDQRRSRGPVRRITFQHIRGEGGGNGACLGHRCAGHESRLEKTRMIAALRELISGVGLQLVDHFDRDEYRGNKPADHPAVHPRCHADDGVLPAREPHGLPNDFRIGAVRPLPIVV